MRHLLCLTVDTDPDGLSGRVTNRQALSFAGLKNLLELREEIARQAQPGNVPLTWFIRADGQLESILGSAEYLLEEHNAAWTELKKSGHELAWHPHLYRQSSRAEAANLISDPAEAEDELERLWAGIKQSFHPRAFRNGEGWHTPQTYAVVERFGFACDSTAIPGRRGSHGHPMNWEKAPNQPYSPSSADLCTPGTTRSMLELPMNTWHLEGPDDQCPRLRYMNPAVHPKLFAKALRNWENACTGLKQTSYVWVMIFHPDEVDPNQPSDPLYSRSVHDLSANLAAFDDTLRRLKHGFEWLTISDAAAGWRSVHEA